jgi:two-component system, OmpR family, KDP operon response regulator KdpE
MITKVLLASDSVSSGFLWNLRLQVKDIALVTEPDLSHLVQRCLEENPDLIVLDLNPQNPKELNLIHELREAQTVPLLILLSIQDAELVRKVYEAGADDCVFKTIDPDIFLAKMNAWLNRSLAVPTEMLDPLRVGKVYLVPMDRLVSLGKGCTIHLTSLETRLLYVLMSHPGRTFRTEELLRKVWTEKSEVGGDVLKNMICRLRQRLEEEPTGLHCILTIPGVGYKFELLAERGTPKHRGRHILQMDGHRK